MTTTVEPPLGQFEERLLAELKEFVGGQPAMAPAGSRPPRRRRVLLAATAVGASAAVAAGLLIATAPRPAPAPGSGYTLDAFLTAAASAALAAHTPLPAPDQAFYDKEIMRTTRNHRGQCGVRWSLHPLTGVGVQITYLSFDARGNVACSGYLRELPIIAHLGARSRMFSADHLYPPLYSLPVRPQALRSALYAAAARGSRYWGLPVYAAAASGPGYRGLPSAYTADEVVFTLAGRLLEGPVSGSLRAAVYEVIARLPGVRLIQHASDAIGRHGVGIEMRGLPGVGGGSPWTIELIIAPHTYQFLGIAYHSAGYQLTSASIGSGLVTRPRS